MRTIPHIVVGCLLCALLFVTACRCRKETPVPEKSSGVSRACALSQAVPATAGEPETPAALTVPVKNEALEALSRDIGQIEQDILKTGEKLILAERTAREQDEAVQAAHRSMQEARTAYYQSLGNIDEIKTLREEQSALEDRYRELLAERSKSLGDDNK